MLHLYYNTKLFLICKLHTLGDSLSERHNNMEFSTKDVDNDENSGSCSITYGGVGNWFKNCNYQNFNGEYGSAGDSGWNFMMWYHFDNNQMALQKMRWMLREVA